MWNPCRCAIGNLYCSPSERRKKITCLVPLQRSIHYKSADKQKTTDNAAGSKRYFVEKSLRDAKKELGLNEYQTRSAESWHKHTAMIMLAQLFLNDEKIHLYEQEKLWMTTQDVIQTLQSMLFFIKRSIENLLDNILAKQPTGKRLVKISLFLRIWQNRSK